jgi:hypothetical protein
MNDSWGVVAYLLGILLGLIVCSPIILFNEQIIYFIKYKIFRMKEKKSNIRSFKEYLKEK